MEARRSGGSEALEGAGEGATALRIAVQVGHQNCSPRREVAAGGGARQVGAGLGLSDRASSTSAEPTPSPKTRVFALEFSKRCTSVVPQRATGELTKTSSPETEGGFQLVSLSMLPLRAPLP